MLNVIQYLINFHSSTGYCFTWWLIICKYRVTYSTGTVWIPLVISYFFCWKSIFVAIDCYENTKLWCDWAKRTRSYWFWDVAKYGKGFLLLSIVFKSTRIVISKGFAKMEKNVTLVQMADSTKWKMQNMFFVCLFFV